MIIEINKKVYDFFQGIRSILEEYGAPVMYFLLIVVAAVAIVVSLVGILIFLIKNPNIAIATAVVLTLITALAFAITKFCVPTPPPPDLRGIVIPDYTDGFPLKLVLFIKEIIGIHQKDVVNIYTRLLIEHSYIPLYGRNPYPYNTKQTELEYIETCLIYDYQKCLVGEGIFQDVYDDLFKPSKEKEIMP
jgi:hypothetical protein